MLKVKNQQHSAGNKIKVCTIMEPFYYHRIKLPPLSGIQRFHRENRGDHAALPQTFSLQNRQISGSGAKRKRASALE